jgi:hypothetical protein
MKTTSSIISSLVLILSISACGGSSSDPGPTEECVYQLQYSAWNACQPDGTQTRTILSRYESIPGCSTLILGQLSQPCAYVAPGCPEQTPNVCKVSNTLSMCCPAAAGYYCARLNVCLTDGMTADAYCGTAVSLCTVNF